ncbi:MAG: capsular biosynthesis protein [Pseudomonadota bacterium]
MQRGGEGRVFLLLQGPFSWFFTYLAAALRDAGADVHRVNFCPGDIMFWRGPNGTSYRGDPDDWPGYLERLIADRGITDIAGLGDGRRWHEDGYHVAREHGLRVHVIEQGYIRPHFLTVEPDGTGGRTRFPRDWAAIEALAKGSDMPEAPRFQTSFLKYAAMDVGYNLVNLLSSWLLFPRFRRHSLDHPLTEWSGWIWNRFRPHRRRHRMLAEAEARLKAHQGPVYVLPLQLDTDYQIRIHAPPGGVAGIIDRTVASFAAHAPPDALLVVKVHPLDHGWTDWRGHLAKRAGAAGCAARCVYFDGGDLEAMLQRASGTVVANSTVGLSALQAGSPVIALGTAIYDLEGLCYQGQLDEFWQNATQPDAARLDMFLRAIATSIHVPGGFDGTGAQPGARAMAAKMLAPPPY